MLPIIVLSFINIVFMVRIVCYRAHLEHLVPINKCPHVGIKVRQTAPFLLLFRGGGEPLPFNPYTGDEQQTIELQTTHAGPNVEPSQNREPLRVESGVSRKLRTVKS